MWDLLRTNLKYIMAETFNLTTKLMNNETTKHQRRQNTKRPKYRNRYKVYEKHYIEQKSILTWIWFTRGSI